MTFLIIAWRNILRRSRQSLILLLAISSGIFTLIVYFAMVDGFLTLMTDTLINNGLGHIQIHHKNYLLENDVKLIINNPELIISKLQKTPGISGISPRVICQGLISSPDSSNFANVYGIDPALESSIVNLRKRLIKGEMVTNNDTNKIVIGSALADKLKVGIGDKIVVMNRDTSGDLNGTALKVKGLFKTTSKEYEKTIAYVSVGTARKMAGLSNAIHEIAIKN